VGLPGVVEVSWVLAGEPNGYFVGAIPVELVMPIVNYALIPSGVRPPRPQSAGERGCLSRSGPHANGRQQPHYEANQELDLGNAESSGPAVQRKYLGAASSVLSKVRGPLLIRPDLGGFATSAPLPSPLRGMP
jgi:hypothetical protein